MCGKGSLGERLANAGISLHTLQDDDLSPGNLHDELKYVLQWTRDNLRGDSAVAKVPDDVELHNLIDKMLHILHETTRVER
jgi:hypothetical protein